jgi:putative transposase
MKKKRFSVEQIVAVLKQAELGMPVAELIRQVGISDQTFYRWKKQYAGMQSDQVRELIIIRQPSGLVAFAAASFTRLGDEIFLGVFQYRGASRSKFPNH